MDVQMHTLTNGVTVVIDPVPHAKTVSVGLLFKIGSRVETPDQKGVAHFLEHMAFKGTPTRTADQLHRDMEFMGARPNAFTSMDATFYQLDGFSGEASSIVSVLCDAVVNSALPPAEIEHERPVILQELMDNGGESDGILGTAEDIASIDREKLKAFKDRFYRGGNLIVSIAGNVDPKRILEDIEQGVGGVAPGRVVITFVTVEQAIKEGIVGAAELEAANKNGAGTPKGGPRTKADNRMHIKSPQDYIDLNVVFGGAAADSREEVAEKVLSVILGGGMSSRLYTEVRDKRSLAYSIGTEFASTSGHGLFTLGGSFAPDNVDEAVNVIESELLRIAAERVSVDELKKAKNQLKFDLAQAEESMAERMENNAFTVFRAGRPITTDEQIRVVDSITVADVQAAARRVFAGHPTVLTMGPGKSPKVLDAFAREFENKVKALDKIPANDTSGRPPATNPRSSGPSLDAA